MPITIEPGQAIKFEAEIRTETVEGTSGAFIGILDTDSDSRRITNTHDWQLVEIVIVNSSARRQKVPFCLRLGHYGATVTGKAWFRNIAAYPVKINHWQDINIIHFLGE